MIGLVYRLTHRGISYSQSYVQTLVMMGMVVSLIMLVVGSNIARAFALVGALSIIRFRNAIKETRDVGFIFFAMAIGMATGTRFYTARRRRDRRDLRRRPDHGPLRLVQARRPEPGRQGAGAAGRRLHRALDDVFVRYTSQSELVSVESIRGGALTELMYTVQLKGTATPPS